MKTKHERIFTLNDPHALRICGSLAQEIGLNESIILLQLEFLISLPPEKEYDGRRWTYQSISDLQKYFPWWSPATINRTIKNLEEKELILIANYNKHKYDRTRWFALNPVGIEKLKSIAIAPTQDETRSNQNETRSTQNDTTIPETTTEMTTETTTEPSTAPAKAGEPAPKRKNPPENRRIGGQTPSEREARGKARSKTKKKPTPIAVRVFRENAHRYPAKAWYENVADVVGDKPADLKRWGQVVKAWVGLGWKPTNVKGMLDCFKRNEIPGDRDAKKRKSDGPVPVFATGLGPPS